MKKIIFIIFLSFVVFSSSLNFSSATQLPDPVISLIKKTFPKAVIRFDGLIELPDGVSYIPVFPTVYAKVDKPSSISFTIPSKASLLNEPDLVLFANNLSLLKLLKTPKGYTFIKSPDIPMAVKFGILPQDLVVPENLIVPEELKTIIGSLKIQTSEKLPKHVIPSNIKKIITKPVSTISFYSSPNIFYLVNLHSSKIYLVSIKTGKLIKTLDIDSAPSSIAITPDKKYILTSNVAAQNVSIINSLNNKTLKKIAVGKFPESIVISEETNKAYVANKLSSSISVIDLVNQEKKEDINISGSPVKLEISEDNQFLYYADEITGKIYRIDLVSSKKNKITPIAQINNISKMEQFKNHLCVLSRSENTLNVFDLTEKKLIKTIEVDKKPVDVKFLPKQNKIYVLSAESNSIDVINPENYEIVKKIQLKGNYFPVKISIYNSGNKAVINTANSYEMAIIDTQKDEIIDYFPTSIPVNSLVIKD